MQCDRREGSCGQCKRAHIQCSGYPNLKNLVFRDETKKIVERNKLSPSRKRWKTSALGPCVKSQGLPQKREKYQSQLVESPNKSSSDINPFLLHPIILPTTHTIEERAKKLFIQNQLFDCTSYLPTYSVLRSFGRDENAILHLAYAARAVSLVHLAKHHRSTSILQRARQNYVAALKQVQEQISNIGGATHDSTLIAVLFLAVFERLVGNEKVSGGEVERAVQQAAHLDGALTLVKFRGQIQFDCLSGMTLFRQLSSAVLTSCLEREVEIPAQFITVRDLAVKSRNPSSLRWRLEQIMVRFVSLRADSKSGKISDEEIDAIAEELDSECSVLYHRLQSHEIGVEFLDLGDGLTRGNEISEHTAPIHQFLTQLSIIRLVLAETSSMIRLSSKTTEVMTTLCYTIHISATDNTHYTPAHTLFFPLYIAACSRFCSWDLKEQIKSFMNTNKHESAYPLARISNLYCNELTMGMKGGISNPWRDFAEHGLGDFSVFSVL